MKLKHNNSDLFVCTRADARALYMANKAHLLVILRLCTLPVLPYSLTSVADCTLAVLNDLQVKAERSFDLMRARKPGGLLNRCNETENDEHW